MIGHAPAPGAFRASSAPSSPRSSRQAPLVKTVSRVSGIALLLLTLLPLHRVGSRGLPGSPTEHLRTLSESYFQASWMGLLAAALLGGILGLTPLPRTLVRWGGVAARPLLAPRPWAFALGAGLLAALLTLALSAWAFALQPALLDAISQLVHARYLASGSLAGPALEDPGFFSFQYMVNLPSGWASQYPPGHLWALALGFLAGAPWLVGPLLALVAVAFTSRLGEELLEDPLPARLGAVLLAMSPFFMGHNASFMNHGSAAAWGVVALLCVLRGAGASGASGGLAWILVAGGAAGMVAASRPLGGLVILVVALALLVRRAGPAGPPPPARTLASRLGAFGLGALGPVALAALHNAVLFGSPARFGYDVAQGPGHGPGFHLDPWGQVYTPLEGLAQTSSAVVALGMDLLFTPVSALVLVALVLVLRAPGPRGMGPLLLWALLPLALHFFYWHHDLFLGPRLLHEFAPAWALLLAAAMVEAGRWAAATSARTPPPRFNPGGALVAVAWLAALGALLVEAPRRLPHYASSRGGATAPEIPRDAAPALVFVHGDWSDRLAARLAATGMRLDSVRTAIRYSTSCELQEHLDALRVTPTRAPPLHFHPTPERSLEQFQLPSGTRIVTLPGESPTPACAREVGSDRFGIAHLPPLLWQGDLPGLEAGAPLYVRDLGPEANERILARYPDRVPLLHLPVESMPGGAVVPYQEGIRRLWDGEFEGG